VRRREFITLVGGAVAWPLAAHAQQLAMLVIGYLSARSPDDTWHLVEAFRRGLHEAGFVEGQNATIEYRWALGEQERLAGLASDLVRKPVTVLVATGGESAALAPRPQPRLSQSHLSSAAIRSSLGLRRATVGQAQTPRG
jgi:hypothetical protein